MRDSDWKILTVLYEKRSMTKAAEALYMTQSALTKRIKAMEDEWHVEIVKRSSQGVLFTDEGKYLVQKASIMMDFLKEIEEHFADRTAKELLKIGVPNSFARLHMPALLRAYMERYDRLQIRMISNSSDIIMQQLMDGTVDMGIICGDYPYLGEKICLFEEELYIVTQKDRKLDDIAQMPLIESYFNPMVKMTVHQWWKHQFGNLPHDTHRVPYADIAIEMAENGLGNTYLFGNDWKINEEKLQKIPVYDRDDTPVRRSVWMMLSERCYQSQDIMDFVSLVEEYYEK
ncbi:MAG: LysR family transcriptional regulator [Lachnospiraceae bacterium]